MKRRKRRKRKKKEKEEEKEKKEKKEKKEEKEEKGKGEFQWYAYRVTRSHLLQRTKLELGRSAVSLSLAMRRKTGLGILRAAGEILPKFLLKR